MDAALWFYMHVYFTVYLFVLTLRKYMGLKHKLEAVHMISYSVSTTVIKEQMREIIFFYFFFECFCKVKNSVFDWYSYLSLQVFIYLHLLCKILCKANAKAS